MKNLKLTLLCLVALISLITSASARTKALTCSRKVDLMFGNYQQGDLIYTDIYLDEENVFELEIVSETNTILAKASANQSLFSSKDISDSLIAASWNLDGKRVDLRLAYFGGVKWMGLVMFPMGLESSSLPLSPGAEIEVDCREINLSALE